MLQLSLWVFAFLVGPAFFGVFVALFVRAVERHTTIGLAQYIEPLPVAEQPQLPLEESSSPELQRLTA